MKKIKKASVLLLSVLLTSCGATQAKGTAHVDVMTSAQNGPLHPQVSSMIGAVTDLVLDLDLKAKTYSFVKEYYSYGVDESGAAITSGTKALDVTFTFTGNIQSSKGDTYVLDKASGVSYSASWGSFEATLSPAGLIPFTGSGNETSNPEMLNYFYTPYLKDNKENTKTMEVTVKDDTLSFPGFSLVEQED